MDDLYRNMMNRGFLIFESDAKKFTLAKRPTPADSRDFSDQDFNSWSDAFNKAKELSNLQVNKWKVLLKYNHSGLGMQFTDLGEIKSMPYKEAKLEADKMSLEFFATLDDEFIVGWEARISPLK